MRNLSDLSEKFYFVFVPEEPIQALETLRVELVSCGKEHSLAVCYKGRVFAWGAGSEGQLGIGEFKEINLIPQ